MEVLIVRQPLNYIKCNPIDVKYIENIHWGSMSGGVKVLTADDHLYGYIPYEMAMELVDCSGTHKKYNNNVKICILKDKNIRQGYKDGYEYCVENALNEKRKSYVSCTRPEGYPPCTKQIIKILKQQEGSMISRGKLREEIVKNIGYPATTFRSAVKSLEKTNRIRTEGDSLSPKQKIILV